MQATNSIEPHGVISPFILISEPIGNKCVICGSYDTHNDNRIIQIGRLKYTKISCKPCGYGFWKEIIKSI